MARRVVRSFRRGPRRATDWSASSVAAAFVSLAGATSALSQVFTPIVGGETVIRTRGMFGWGTDNPAGDEPQMGAYGIAIVSEPAATVGITAIPTPGTDASWGGWLYHTYFMSNTEFASAVGVNFDNIRRIVIDSKAMRKVDENDRLVTVVENMSADGMVFQDFTRFLSKVH